MNIVSRNVKNTLSAMALILLTQQVHAAIALDRTRVIFNGDQPSLALTISNQNRSLPYLAQSWIEDAQGKKLESPMTALPPVQRVEPGAKGQIKVQMTGGEASLPQDRETLFYFNVREIPPKSNKANTLQLALQTRVKMFYRPQAIAIARGNDNEAQKKLTLTRQGDSYQVNNPTPYYITLVSASSSAKGKNLANFKPVMVAPKSNAMLGSPASELGNQPVLTFINDFGGRPQLIFNCSGVTCSVSNIIAG